MLSRTYRFDLGSGLGLGGQGVRLSFLLGKKFGLAAVEVGGGSGGGLVGGRRQLVVRSIEWTSVHGSLVVGGVHLKCSCLSGDCQC
jgi:hypothetical protein